MFANEEFTINEGETYTGTIWLNKKWGTPLQIGLVTENRERQAMASNNDYKLNPQTIEFKPGENEQKFIIEALKKPSENSGFHPFCEEKSPDSSTSHPMKNARRTDRLDDP